MKHSFSLLTFLSFGLMTFMLLSCGEVKEKTVYTYNGVSIQRIDESSQTSFYYESGESNSIGPIWVEYSGINDGFSGYLVLKKSGKVTLLSGDGYFQSENLDTSKFEYKRILAYQRPEDNSNVYKIQLAINYEKESNKLRNSRVQVIYSDKE